MKYTKGGFPFKSSPAKVDLTKKTGLGPRTDEAMNKQFPQGDDKFREDQEDKKFNDNPQPTYEGTDEYRKEEDIPSSEFEERGVKKSRKVFKDGKKNKSIYKGKIVD